jgi:hypothetical protein
MNKRKKEDQGSFDLITWAKEISLQNLVGISKKRGFARISDLFNEHKKIKKK